MGLYRSTDGRMRPVRSLIAKCRPYSLRYDKNGKGSTRNAPGATGPDVTGPNGTGPGDVLGRIFDTEGGGGGGGGIVALAFPNGAVTEAILKLLGLAKRDRGLEKKFGFLQKKFSFESELPLICFCFCFFARNFL